MRPRRRASGPEPTTVAIAGWGVIAKAHAAAAGALGWRVTAIASREPDRVGADAAAIGARAISYDALPAGAQLVVVSTPPFRHADDAIAVLDAGGAVVVEKPLCTTLADADRLVDAAARHHDRLLYAENLAFAPAVEAAVPLIAELGPLRHLHTRTVSPLPTWGGFTTEAWGGGVLFDLGAHPLAVVLLCAHPARATSVHARLEQGQGHGSDVHADVTVGFDSGLTAELTVSWRTDATAALWDLQAASDDGVVRVELLPVPTLERNGEPVVLPRSTTTPPQLAEFGYCAQLAAFAASVGAQQRSPLGALFGRLVLDVTCAAYRSAATGRPEPLPFTGPRDRTPLQLWRS